MNYVIRKRRIDDCYDIAKVVTIGWDETYKGIVPNWFLEKLKNNENDRARKMIDEFDENNNNQFVLEVDNKVVGFVNFGKSSDADIKNCGEIFALYIINDYKGNGFGKKLVEVAGEELKSKGFDKMIIACLKGNPSNEFYKHIGGKYLKDGVYKKLNLPENVYYYDI